MKILTIISILVSIYLCDYSYANEIQQAKSIEEIRTWSASATGGGWIEEIKHEGRHIVVVSRSFTVGVASADLSIFVKYDDVWRRTLKREVLIGETILVKRDNETLSFITNKGRLLMTVQIDGLYDGQGGRK